MALSPDELLLYVADPDNGRVAVLDAESLKLIGKIGEGTLSQPIYLDLSKDGDHLFVADADQERIVVFSLAGVDGNMERRLVTSGTPSAVAAHPSGLLFVAEKRTGKIAVFNENSSFRIGLTRSLAQTISSSTGKETC